MIYDCQECGQRVGVRERHTFLDCALYLAEVNPDRLERRHILAMVRDIRERGATLREGGGAAGVGSSGG